jgi:hypothetical protein
MLAFIDAHRAEYGVEPICMNRPGQRSFSSVQIVFACRPASWRSSASTSGHTSANGSGRVRHVWGTLVCEGARPEWAYLRAVRSLIPAFAAAVTWGIPCVNNDMSSLTCSSVTTQPPL